MSTFNLSLNHWTKLQIYFDAVMSTRWSDARTCAFLTSRSSGSDVIAPVSGSAGTQTCHLTVIAMQLSQPPSLPWNALCQPAATTITAKWSSSYGSVTRTSPKRRCNWTDDDLENFFTLSHFLCQSAARTVWLHSQFSLKNYLIGTVSNSAVIRVHRHPQLLKLQSLQQPQTINYWKYRYVHSSSLGQPHDKPYTCSIIINTDMDRLIVIDWWLLFLETLSVIHYSVGLLQVNLSSFQPLSDQPIDFTMNSAAFSTHFRFVIRDFYTAQTVNNLTCRTFFIFKGGSLPSWLPLIPYTPSPSSFHLS